MLEQRLPLDLIAVSLVARRAARVMRTNHPSFSTDDARQTAVEAIFTLHARTGTIDQSHWYTRARNAVVDELRRLQPNKWLNDVQPEDCAPAPTTDFLLRKRLKYLPDDEREAVISVVMWETPARDVAASCGVSAGVIRDRVARGLARLRAIL